jgi:ABC-type transporter MlaC component
MTEATQLAATVKSPGKKETRKHIVQKLTAAMEEYREQSNKKEFSSALKKAGKLFTSAIVKKSKKEKPAVKPVKAAKKSKTGK